MTPPDYLDPAWDNPDDAYDWRNYVVTELAAVWLDMAEADRLAIATKAYEISEIARRNYS